jgi:hypothetical protein
MSFFPSLYLPLQGNKKDELALQVAENHRIPYFYRSFSAKEPYD